ncbi:MAG: hypothetical protein PF542_00915 [Nanoarchaeota archaeon]|jgi:hypothetical protein|nr:hypothetical protein [Nanoarchaeota archaeon]
MLRDDHRRAVINYVDKDSNGFSFSEDYRIKEMMGVQDSSKNYEPSSDDWERAYKKMNNSLEGVVK